MRLERRLFPALWAIVLLSSALGSLCSPPADAASHVCIVSMDGLAPYVLARANAPNITRLCHAGSYTWSARTVSPSLTLPAHASMLSGLLPDKHHVLWNEYQRERGYISVPTVFSYAKAIGGTTAMFVGKRKFLHLAAPGSVDRFAEPGFDAMTIARAAAAYIRSARPTLCFVHFPDPDTAGHVFGWGSQQQIAAIENSDRALGILMDAMADSGISQDSVVIVTADHGGHETTHGSDSPEDMTIPWICAGRGIRQDYAIPQAVRIVDTAAVVLWALGIPTPQEFDGYPVPGIFSPQTTGILDQGH